jgi:hypothetical protein
MSENLDPKLFITILQLNSCVHVLSLAVKLGTELQDHNKCIFYNKR